MNNSHTKHSDRRKSYLRRIPYIVCIMLTVCSLSGCGKKQVEYGSGDGTNLASNSDSQVNNLNSNIAEAIGAEDRWEEELDVSLNEDFFNADTIDINANVSIPDVGSLKTIDAERLQIDEAYKKNVMEALREGNVYKYDDAYIPKSDLEYSINYLEQNITNVAAEYADEEEMNSLYSSLAELEEQRDNAPDDYVVAEDYSCSNYILERNGVDYVVNFVDNNDTTFSSYVFMAPKLMTDLVDSDEEYENVYFEQVKRIPYGSEDNEYKLNLEDVKKQAEKFLNGLGIEGFKVVESWDLIWNPDKGQSWSDGCRLTMYRYIDGVQVDGQNYDHVGSFHFYTDEENIAGISNNYGFERIDLCINDKGVIYFSYYFPLKVKESESVSILSYESAKSAIVDAVTGHPDNIQSSKEVKYDTLELLYYRFKESDESNEFCIVPAWRLSYVSGQNITSCIMINAIDGSFIDVGGDLFH